MKDWLILTVVISVLSSVLSFLLSDDEMKRAFRILSGAVMVLVMLLPLTNLSDNLDLFDDEIIIESFSDSFNEEKNDVIYTSVKNGYENLLREHILKEFSNVIDIKVNIIFADDLYRLSSVEIILAENTDKYIQIEDKIHKITDSDCEVFFINGY